MTTLFNLEEYAVNPSRPIDPYWDDIVLDCSGKVEDNGQVTLFYDESDEPPDPDDFTNQDDFELAWSRWEKQHPDFKPDMTFPEQTDEDFMDVLEESQVKGWHFEEGKVYWHSSRNSQFKIIKLFNTVSKAQGYFAGEVVNEKVCLSELVPVEEKATLPEQSNSVLEKSKVNQWVEAYYVSRSGNKYWYYRYCYYQRKIKHIHIPGGNTMSDRCLEIKERIERAIALGKPPSEIKLLIKPVAA